MSFLTNGPSCDGPGPHKGLIHQAEAQMVAELDGTPVNGAPKEKAYFCEGCFPDKDDPKFLLCACELCLKRRKVSGGN